MTPEPSVLTGRSSLSDELSRLFRLAWPVVGAQLGTMAMGTVDTLMVARVGVDSLAAAAIGNAWIWGVLLMGQGFVHGLDPVVTQAHGARDGARAGLALQRMAVLALALSVPLAAALAATEPALVALGQDPDLARRAGAYALVQVPSVPCLMLFMALRQYLQGRELVRPALWVVAVANAVNALANWMLIFGHGGLPALGLLGAGIATAIVRAFMLGALVWLVWFLDLHRDAWVPVGRAAFRWRPIRELLALGTPVALQMALEVGAFTGATLIVGRLGAAPLSAHTIVMNLASLSFMLPLGIAQGAVTRVGNLLGAGHAGLAQRAAWVALGAGAGVMSLSAVAFVTLRHRLPLLYSDDVAVGALAASILPFAAAFQVFDGSQVVGCGVLRGMGRTRPAAWFNLLGYWALALPVAAWLGLWAGWGIQGVWLGLCVGLAVVACCLVAWIRVRGPARAGSPLAAPGSMGHDEPSGGG